MNPDSSFAESAECDRLPPHDLDAERCLVGSFLLAGVDKAAQASIRAAVSPANFFSADYAALFSAAAELMDAGRPVDAVTVRAELARRGVLEEIGGVAFVADTIGSVPSYAHAAGYAAEVRECARWREVIAAGNDAIRRAHAARRLGGAAGASAYALELGGRLARVARDADGQRVWSADDMAAALMGDPDAGSRRFVPTGLSSLDAVVGGLPVGGKCIVGGKPGMGKSALMKQLALNLSGSGFRVGYISVEEPWRKVAENLTANLGDVPNNRVAFGRLTSSDRAKFLDGARALAALPLWVVDSARRLSDVRAAAQRLACEHGAEVVMVDHLHLIDPGAGDNREREISVISAELKWTWKELGVCGVEAAQLNRKGGDERPWLDNLRDSGSLEQDGDTIVLLHREDYYRRSDPGYVPDGVLEAIVAKNKSGATGTVPLAFDESRQRIIDPAGCGAAAPGYIDDAATEGMF